MLSPVIQKVDLEKKFSLDALTGVGPKTVKALNLLRIYSIVDLWLYQPIRYLDKTRLTAIRDIIVDTECLIEGTINKITTGFSNRGRNLLIQINEKEAHLQIRLFHFNRFQMKSFTVGKKVRCFGKIRQGRYSLEMIHPEYKIFSPETSIPLPFYLSPVYRIARGITSKKMEALIKQSLAQLDESCELLDKELLGTSNHLPSFQESVRTIHKPPAEISTTLLSARLLPCHQRLMLEELVSCQLLSGLRKLSIQRTPAASMQSCDQSARAALIKSLPFKLTTSQKSIIKTLYTDLAKSHPMLRLLQGDVGTGKTIVTAFAALRTLCNNFQVALIAPTQILAEQHERSFQKWFSPLNIPIVSLSSNLTKIERKDILEQIASKSPLLIIGTHALFQESVAYKNLGLILFDELHRFGVEQRKALIDKGKSTETHPHQLIMSATPIPRTLAMGIYGDIDLSILSEYPAGRKKISTRAIPVERRAEVIKKVESACLEGKQVFWVTPLIEESDQSTGMSAKALYALLCQSIPRINIALIHGKITSVQKESIMRDFRDAKISLLVATSVIEVGVDIPKATIMIIENAERLGLAQLHQLRGRVGRGNQTSSCLLLFRSPLSPEAKQRLQTIRNENDGLVIAEQDLKLRGPGEIFSTRQTGLPELRFLHALGDQALLEQAGLIAKKILNTPKHKQLANAIINRWAVSNISYSDV